MSLIVTHEILETIVIEKGRVTDRPTLVSNCQNKIKSTSSLLLSTFKPILFESLLIS